MASGTFWSEFGEILKNRDGTKCFYCNVETIESDDRWRLYRNACELRDAGLIPYSDVVRIYKELQSRQVTVDHSIPVSRGGKKYDIENMVVCCFACNSKKNVMTPIEFAINCSEWITSKRAAVI